VYPAEVGDHAGFQAILAVFVQPGDDADAVVPAAKYDDVTRLVFACAGENFEFQVAVGRRGFGVEFDAGPVGKGRLQPQPGVFVAGDVCPPVPDLPFSGLIVPVRAKRVPVEVVGKYQRPARHPIARRPGRGPAARQGSGRKNHANQQY